jgi:TRAP-type mannitol/chloroaromatic compound transport system substrate-binding protein
MKRRSFIATGAGSLAAAATIKSHAQTSGAPAITWRLASSFPKALDTIYGGADEFAKIVSALTDGKFKITVAAPGEIVPALGNFEAVQKGTIQAAHTAGYYFLNINKALAFDTTLPFGMNQRQHNAWVYQGGGMELLRDLFSQYNIVNFPMGNTGAQMGGWYNKEIRSLEDVKGLKIRIPGFGGEIWKQLGAAPVGLPGGEIVNAIKDKKIDAAEWVGPYDDNKLGLPGVARYYFYPAWWEPSAALSLYVNKAAYEALPPAYKEAIRVASESVNQWMMAAYDTRNPGAFKQMIGSGTRLQLFPNSLMIAAYRSAIKIYDAESAANPAFKKLYGPWKKYKSEINEWHKTAEAAMTNFLANWKAEG